MRSPLIRPPQSPQNHDTTVAPEGASRRHPVGVPATTRKASVATGMFSANALPDWRWQSVQWHA